MLKAKCLDVSLSLKNTMLFLATIGVVNFKRLSKSSIYLSASTDRYLHSPIRPRASMGHVQFSPNFVTMLDQYSLFLWCEPFEPSSTFDISESLFTDPLYSFNKPGSMFAELCDGFGSIFTASLCRASEPSYIFDGCRCFSVHHRSQITINLLETWSCSLLVSVQRVASSLASLECHNDTM
jgi:hypothetical protein